MQGRWTEGEWANAKWTERLVHWALHGSELKQKEDTMPGNTEWWKPAVTTLIVTTIVGVTIWLIQLNAVELLQEQRLSRLEQQAEEQSAILQTQTVTLERMLGVLGRLETRMSKAEDHVVTHERDAEQWKRKILMNEHRLNGNNQQ